MLIAIRFLLPRMLIGAEYIAIRNQHCAININFEAVEAMDKSRNEARNVRIELHVGIYSPSTIQQLAVILIVFFASILFVWFSTLQQ